MLGLQASLCVIGDQWEDTSRPCTHEYTAVAVYRQTGHMVGEALVRKKKEIRRSRASTGSGVGEGVLGGDHK